MGPRALAAPGAVPRLDDQVLGQPAGPNGWAGATAASQLPRLGRRAAPARDAPGGPPELTVAGPSARRSTVAGRIVAVHVPITTVPQTVALVRRAEELGVRAVWLTSGGYGPDSLTTLA